MVVVGLDVDGIIRDFTKGVYDQYVYEFPEDRDKIICPPTDWGLHKFYPMGKKLYDYVWKERVEQCIENAPLYEDAQWFVSELTKRYEVVIVSSQPNTECVDATYRWLKKNGFLDMVDHIAILISKGKKKFNKGNIRSDILIDDYLKNLQEASDAGIHAVGLERPWNKGRWEPMCKDYTEILSFLERYADGEMI